jgi:hypothetical protein
MSASADLVVKTQGGDLATFQLKDGKQQVTLTIVLAEAKKTLASDDCKTVLTIACIGGIDDTFLQNHAPCEDRKDSVLFKAGRVLSGYTVPAALQIVILKEDGLVHFLTANTLHSLRNFVTLSDVTRALESPQKLRNHGTTTPTTTTTTTSTTATNTTAATSSSPAASAITLTTAAAATSATATTTTATSGANHVSRDNG